MTSQFGSKVQVVKETGFQKKVAQIIVVAESWTDLKVTKVPFNIDVSVGLQ